jgi:hypothetical protein
MDAQEFYGLMEAYQEVYEAKEEQGMSDSAKKYIRGRRYVEKIQGKKGVENYDNAPVEAIGNWVSAARRRAHKAQRNEQVDIYDLVLDHLLDEGFCDDVDAANVIMAHMSEEWLEGILNEVKGMGYVHPTRPDPSRGMVNSPAIKTSRKRIGIEARVENAQERMVNRNYDKIYDDDGNIKNHREYEKATNSVKLSPRLQKRYDTLSSVEDRLHHTR